MVITGQLIAVRLSKVKCQNRKKNNEKLCLEAGEIANGENLTSSRSLMSAGTCVVFLNTSVISRNMDMMGGIFISVSTCELQ